MTRPWPICAEIHLVIPLVPKALKKEVSPSIVSAFVPAHISGFFQPCDANVPERTGSKNCGPCLDRGVVTEVKAEKSDREIVKILINGKRATDAKTTLAAVRQVEVLACSSLKVEISHSCQVPVGAGYGASGAGALGTALALAKALGLRVSRNKVVAAAHVAEVVSYTGLGDVGAQAVGGLVMGLAPGAPPFGKWRRIRFPSRVKVVCATLGPIPSKNFLSDSSFRLRASEFGRVAFNEVLRHPDIRRFILASRNFSEKLGLMDAELQELVETAEKAGAIGASQAMIGRSVFAFTAEKKVGAVRDGFLDILEPSSVMVAEVHGKSAAASLRSRD